MDKINNNISNICNTDYKYLMSLEHVTGIGRGCKFINKINTLEPCIHILVNKKVSKKYLTANNIIPNSYMGIKTDVIEVGTCIESSGDTVDTFPNKFRPLNSGCVIGLNGRGGSGTLGCFVSKDVLVDDSDDSDDEDNNDIENEPSYVKEYFILSNNHVIANRNEAAIGSLIIQPSMPNGGKFPADLVGVLSTFIPIKYIEGNNEPTNYVDCAIAKVIHTRLLSNEILSLGKISDSDIATLNMEVSKVGHVTGATNGVITTLDSTIRIKSLNGKSAVFKNQIISTTKTLVGDSGSGLFTKDNKIIGLVMGLTDLDFSISNDINIVLKELNVDLYTG